MRRFRFWPARRRRARRPANLTWRRLRYAQAGPATRLLVGLSRRGPLALDFQPGPVAALLVGAPPALQPALAALAGSHGCLLDETAPPPERPGTFLPAGALPADRPAAARVQDGVLLVAVAAGPAPVALNGAGPPAWTLPDPPPLGLAATAVWATAEPPADLVVSANGPDRWILGRSGHRVLGARGRLNVYGDPDAAAMYLTPLVLQALDAGPAGLVLVDARGDLVARLRRTSAVTGRVGRELELLDGGGGDPLWRLPGEHAPAQLKRWQAWLAALGLPEAGQGLLAEAQRDGVAQLEDLQRWVSARRGGDLLAADALRQLLARLTASGFGAAAQRPLLEEPQRALFWSGAGDAWTRRARALAVLLAAAGRPATRLVVHGLAQEGFRLPPPPALCAASNGPPLPDATTVLVRCPGAGGSALANRFFGPDLLLREKYRLLASGQGLVLTSGRPVCTEWTSHSNPQTEK